jgi:hypothetical protein
MTVAVQWLAVVSHRERAGRLLGVRNALLANAFLGLDCHEFSSAPSSRASSPPETHASTPREREIE